MTDTALLAGQPALFVMVNAVNAVQDFTWPCQGGR